MESKFFAAVIGRLRLEADLTQEALAEKAGINRTTYGGIERGERPLSDQNLVRLAIALEVRLEDVLAEGYRAHYHSVMQIDRDHRLRQGLAAVPHDDGTAEPTPQVIDTFLSSLKILLASHFRPSLGLDLSKPGKAPLTPPAARPRRRARARRNPARR